MTNVKFSDDVIIHKIPINKTPIIDKDKYYNLYDVKYSKALIKKYDQIQHHILKLLNMRMKLFAQILNDDPDIDPLRINRDDVFWTEDNSPISFMQHITNETNLNDFLLKLKKLVANGVKSGETKRIRFIYPPFIISINKLRRV